MPKNTSTYMLDIYLTRFVADGWFPFVVSTFLPPGGCGHAS